MSISVLCNHKHAYMLEIRCWRFLAIVTHYRTRFSDCPVIPVEFCVYWLKRGEL